MGLTKEDEWLEAAIRDCRQFEENENFAVDADAFKKAHLRIMEISPKIKAMISALGAEDKSRFDKRAEKKVNRAHLNHQQKLQKQLD